MLRLSLKIKAIVEINFNMCDIDIDTNHTHNCKVLLSNNTTHTLRLNSVMIYEILHTQSKNLKYD